MLKNKKFIIPIVVIFLFAGMTLFTTSNDNGSGQVDTVSAATVQLGDEVDRQQICVVIEELTVIDTDDLDDEVQIIEDVEDEPAGTINIYSNEEAKITGYHDEDAYTNPEDFENAVTTFEVRFDASPPVGTGYQNLIGTDEDNAVDLTENIEGVGIEDVPVQYNIGINWDNPPADGTYCTDVIFTLEAWN